MNKSPLRLITTAPGVAHANELARDGAPWPLVARGADGRDRSRDLFAVEDGLLVARTAMVPIMMTTDPRIAVSDCLFYAVEEAPGTTPGH